ncbi:hypothetical protein [Demequina activiva]|uniref:Uncharacterized protein n=1 Tax=Demequina activiva TaxID=1582364 RepID=A0A919Q618_9MICO|nr:hypothetical protein [Demequina activiva]GIG54903.1 hypothetical protein Dac01nite_16550 [Demequina activiva]
MSAPEGHHRVSHDDYAGRALPFGDAQAARVRLESPRRVLPEVEEAQSAGRRWFRHPAFIVSIVTTVLAIVAMVVLLVLDPFGDDDAAAAVDGLTITTGDGSVSLAWSGAADGAALYAYDPGDEAPADLSQLVQGQTAWIPLSAGLYTPRTCFAVMPVSEPPAPVPTAASGAEDAGGSMICVSDG